MYICEKLFDKPDNKFPVYSFHEVDYYGWVPQGKGVENHRLSLRKNLVTGKFEVYRHYYRRRIVQTPQCLVVGQEDTGQEETIFEGTFEEALEFADNEYRQFHGDKEPDRPCRHERGHCDFLCPEVER